MPDRPPTASDDDRVVNIRTGRKFIPSAGTPASDTDELDQYARAEEPDDFRHRMIVNVVAFLFVVLLIGAGVWLADTITTMRKNQDCVLAGKRNCSPAEPLSPR